MSIRRVFLYWTHPLFYDTVHALLSHPGIEWLGSSPDYSSTCITSLAHRPDIIIVEEQAGSPSRELIRILESASWNVRLLGLNIDDNEMHVYDFAQQTVQKLDDMLNWVLND